MRWLGFRNSMLHSTNINCVTNHRELWLIFILDFISAKPTVRAGLIFATSLRAGLQYHPHFTDGKTEAIE